MRRREFIALAAGAAAWPFTRPLAAEAQRRVGALAIANGPGFQQLLDAFRDGLATFGWVEGRNLRIDYRLAGDDPSSLASYAEELVNLRPDVILAVSGTAARTVQRRTSVIAIVFVGGGDPASNGLVRNIARPEGNMTGFANNFGSLGGRWLELFKEAIPRLTRVADVFFADEQSNDPIRASIAAAAAQLGVTTIRMPVHNEVEVEHAISAFAAEPAGGLLLTEAIPQAIAEAIARLALYHHLPQMFGGVATTQPPRSGSAAESLLMTHGPQISDLGQRASSYVDRILRGAKPSELPVQYPTKFELVINLKTAKAIGVTIPETFLAQADEVIE